MSIEHHRFRKSVKYSPQRGCPLGYHKRSAYTVKSTGRYVPSRCIRSTTMYNESQREFKERLSRRAEQRLVRSPAAAEAANSPTPIQCPAGMIARKGYVRHFRSTVRREGYKQTRKGKTIQIRPTARNIYVKPGCIVNRGKLGKGVESFSSQSTPSPQQLIGPLRQGELIKHGYKTDLPEKTRHEALEKALSEFGSLGVFRKLDAVAKLTTRTAPKSSRVFAKDRDWIRRHYNLQAF